MKGLSADRLVVGLTVFMMLVLPAMALAQTEQGAPPPISQPLVTEGIFAVNLANSLGVSSASDAVEAENALAAIGVAPVNGWIADYPMTPDVVGEVRQAAEEAAADRRLSLSREEALQRFDAAAGNTDLLVRSYAGTVTGTDQPASCENYPNPGTVSSAYSSEGPPVVTYYCPPPNYYYQYDWVPYPFYWSTFWFPGYFILHDFHRHARFHGHHVLISNHFNDVRRHRMYRVDPVDRFHGGSFAGIGARPHHRGFISTGTPRGERRIFNSPRTGTLPSNRGGGAATTIIRGGGDARGPGGGSHRSGGSVGGAAGGNLGGRHGGSLGGGSLGGGSRGGEIRGGGVGGGANRGGAAGGMHGGGAIRGAGGGGFPGGGMRR